MDALDHLFHQWLEQLGWNGEALFRILLAAAMGGLVGLERELRGREAGFRTNLLVCVGSALVMLVSMRFADHPWHAGPGYNINVDPARIAYGIMTGVGFLGAGAILKYGTAIRGLTTAAALWCIAAVGLATGFGLYALAMATVVLLLLSLWLLDKIEQVLPRRRFRSLVVRCRWQPQCTRQLIKLLADAGIRVEDHSFRRVGDLSETDVELNISYMDHRHYEAAEQTLLADDNWRLVSSTRT